MPTPDPRQLGRILVDLGVLRMGQLQAALAEQRRSGGRIGQILLDREQINEEDLSRSIAIQKGLEWLPGGALKPSEEAVAMVDAGTARAFGARNYPPFFAVFALGRACGAPIFHFFTESCRNPRGGVFGLLS